MTLQVKNKLEKELTARGQTIEDFKLDKSLRREMMEMLRKNSSLTLVEIGRLCGGYAECTVSAISKEKMIK